MPVSGRDGDIVLDYGCGPGHDLVGFMTAFIGLVLILPLIGHATWHAYRDTIDASEWPENEKV